MKKILHVALYVIIISMVLISVVGMYRFNFTNASDIIPGITAPDVKNTTYTIDGVQYVMKNGTAEMTVAPGVTSTEKLSTFGEPVYSDFNNDGIQDAAVFLVRSSGGSGTFYYAVLNVSKGTRFVTTNALFLGDRIAPQTIGIEKKRAVFNFAERKHDEPMSVPPSIGRSVWINFDLKTGEIGELANNFEGEADTNTMSLTMKKWEWVKTQMNDGKTTTPKSPGAFGITFGKDGKVGITTDCNTSGGSFTVEENKISFSQMFSTMMYCEGSQEVAFLNSLSNVGSYFFTNKGELILEIKMDSGTMLFR